MIFSAAGRCAAISVRGSVSGVKSPQLATSAETADAGLDREFVVRLGIDLLRLVRRESHSMNFSASSRFGAALVIATPEMFRCVPPLVEGREDDVDAFGPGLLFGVGQHLADVIGVAQRDVAFARRRSP